MTSVNFDVDRKIFVNDYHLSIVAQRNIENKMPCYDVCSICRRRLVTTYYDGKCDLAFGVFHGKHNIQCLK